MENPDHLVLNAQFPYLFLTFIVSAEGSGTENVL